MCEVLARERSQYLRIFEETNKQKFYLVSPWFIFSLLKYRAQVCPLHMRYVVGKHSVTTCWPASGMSTLTRINEIYRQEDLEQCCWINSKSLHQPLLGKKNNLSTFCFDWMFYILICTEELKAYRCSTKSTYQSTQSHLSDTLGKEFYPGC